MKKIFAVAIAFFSVSTAFAQEQITDTTSVKTEVLTPNKVESPVLKKGRMFVFFGWNRAMFSNSDIHFSGNGYDFQLNNVIAHDRPTKLSWDYINPAWFTVVQYNFRAGYFFKDNWAIVLGIDHMKYVMKQNQTVDFKGYINDPKYAGMVNNGQVNLADEQFLTFEHTDGLNYENLGVEKYQTLVSNDKWDLVWSYGLGAGFMFPKSNVKLFGNARSDRFHVAGMGTDVRSSLGLVFNKHWMLRLEVKAGYINMWDIKTTLNNKPDKASQDFVFGQALAGIGYTFNTKKQK